MVEEMAQAGTPGSKNWRSAVRSRAAELVGAATESIVLTSSTSAGINLVASGLSWKPSDNIVLKETEHPTVLYPWVYQARQAGFEVRRVRSKGQHVSENALIKAIDHHTRVVAVSHVEFGTGYRNDLPRLAAAAHSARAFFLVDAIQSLGTTPMDVNECAIDCLASGGFKWMCGPRGTGFAYLHPKLMDSLTPPFEDSFNLSSDEEQRAKLLLRAGLTSEIGSAPFAAGWRRLEPRGTSPVLLRGLAMSLSQLLEVGIDRIAQRIDDLIALLLDECRRASIPVLSSQEMQHRSAIVTVGVPFDLTDLEEIQALERRLIEEQLVAHPRAGGLRFGVHAFNNEQDVDRAVRVVAAMWQGHRV